MNFSSSSSPTRLQSVLPPPTLHPSHAHSHSHHQSINNFVSGITRPGSSSSHSLSASSMTSSSASSISTNPMTINGAQTIQPNNNTAANHNTALQQHIAGSFVYSNPSLLMPSNQASMSMPIQLMFNGTANASNNPYSNDPMRNALTLAATNPQLSQLMFGAQGLDFAQSPFGFPMAAGGPHSLPSTAPNAHQMSPTLAMPLSSQLGQSQISGGSSQFSPFIANPSAGSTANSTGGNLNLQSSNAANAAMAASPSAHGQQSFSLVASGANSSALVGAASSNAPAANPLQAHFLSAQLMPMQAAAGMMPNMSIGGLSQGHLLSHAAMGQMAIAQANASNAASALPLPTFAPHMSIPNGLRSIATPSMLASRGGVTAVQPTKVAHNRPASAFPSASQISGSGASCHQCKTSRPSSLLFYCTRTFADSSGKSKQCRKKYCKFCALRLYWNEMPEPIKKEMDRQKDEWNERMAAASAGVLEENANASPAESPEAMEALENFVCPSCRNTCVCAACTRKIIHSKKVAMINAAQAAANKATKQPSPKKVVAAVASATAGSSGATPAVAVAAPIAATVTSSAVPASTVAAVATAVIPAAAIEVVKAEVVSAAITSQLHRAADADPNGTENEDDSDSECECEHSESSTISPIVAAAEAAVANEMKSAIDAAVNESNKRARENAEVSTSVESAHQASDAAKRIKSAPQGVSPSSSSSS